jgi:hypothetical protein
MKKILFICIVFMACQKDHKIEEKKDVCYKLLLLSKTKQKPLVNFDLMLTKNTWLDYRTLIKTFVAQTKTDSNGRASFTIKADSFQESITTSYDIQHAFSDTLQFDSTSDTWKFAGYDGLLFKDGEEIVNFISPVCYLKVILNQERYSELKIDSIYLFTPFSSYMNKDIQLNYDFPRLECSENMKLTYYYYNKGIKSKEYVKDIFISKSSKYKNETIYELEF